MDKATFNQGGQWTLNKGEEVDKSDSIKPFGVSVYDEKANLGRKTKRLGEVVEGAGKNRAVQPFTGVQGTAREQADRQAKKDKAKSKKNPVKVYSDEEKKALAAKMGVGVSPAKPPASTDLTPPKEDTNKSELVKRILAELNDLYKADEEETDKSETELKSKKDFKPIKLGQKIQAGKPPVSTDLPISNKKHKVNLPSMAKSMGLQPTDEQLFGGGVVTQEQADQAQRDWENRFTNFFKHATRAVEKQNPGQSWGSRGPIWKETKTEEEQRISEIPVSESADEQ